MNAEVIPFPTAPEVAQYLEHGWQLCAIAPGSKGPRTKNWNRRENALTGAPPPGWGVGLLHAYSRTACLDFDDLERATAWLAERGIDAQALLNDPHAVRISSGRPNRAKLLYRLPEPLRSLKLADGALELRCATSQGTSLQDALPGTIHPKTGKPYEWSYSDDLLGDWRHLPELPTQLRALWDSLTRPTGPPLHDAAPLEGEEVEIAERLGKMLEAHDPDCGYDAWIKVGMALHHGTAGDALGLDLWDEWSSKGGKYNGRDDLEKHWASFRSDGPGPKVTLSSLTVHATPDLSLMDDLSKEMPLPAVRPQLNFDTDKAGRIKPTLKNIELAMSRPDWTGVNIAFDSFKDEIMLAPVGTQDWRALRDEDITQLMLNFEHVGCLPIDRKRMRDTLWLVARRNVFDSAQVWLRGLKWDGTPRVARFLADYAGAEDTPYTAAVSHYLWTALAGRIFEPGCQADMVPILVGPQGARKTSVVKALAPAPDFFLEVDLKDKDVDLSRKMRGCLVGELSELQGLSSREVESVKTFISRTHERWVAKYMECASTFARRVVFIGTTNQEQFLVDETGNRRWLPVRVTALEAARVAADREQLWAEGAALWHEGGVAWQDAERLARPRHEAHMVHDSWEDKLRDWLGGPDFLDGAVTTDDAPPRGARPFTTAEAFEGIGVKAAQVTKTHDMRIARILKAVGYVCRRTLVEGRQRRLWSKG